jgi:hypothetical protein
MQCPSPERGAVLFAAYVCSFSVLAGLSRTCQIPYAIWPAIDTIGLLCTLLPLEFDSSICRYLGGVFTLLCFLSIHARVCRLASPYMWRISITQASEGTLTSSPSTSTNIPLFSISHFRYCLFWGETLDSLFYSTQSYIEDLDLDLISGMSILIRFSGVLAALFVGDGCVLVLFQSMPRLAMDRQEHVYLSSGLVGVWLYCAMHLAYEGHQLLLALGGRRLADRLRHRTPIISTSLTEFWSVRWNPVVMKLLQNAVYIPLRRLQVSPALCVAATFCLSGWLHAYPQYIHSFEATDALSTAGFFALHGLLVAFERMVRNCYFPPAVLAAAAHAAPAAGQKPSGKLFRQSPSVSAGSLANLDLNCYHPLAIDLVFYSFAICCVVYVLSLYAMSVYDTNSPLFGVDAQRGGDHSLPYYAAGIVGYAILRIALHLNSVVRVSAPASASAHPPIPAPAPDFPAYTSTQSREKAVCLAGWLWTATCMYISLPLLALPAVRVLESSYNHSFFMMMVLCYLPDRFTSVLIDGSYSCYLS